MTPEQGARLKALSDLVKKTGIDEHIASKTHLQAQRQFDEYLQSLMAANAGNGPTPIDKAPSAPPSWLAANQG